MVNEGLITKGRRLELEAHSGRRPEPAFAADLTIPTPSEPPWPPAGCWPRASTPARAPPPGKICFHASDAEQQWLKDNKVQLILVRRETSPEDLRGHEDRAGHSDRVRRRQLARRPGQPPDGQGLHRGLRRLEHRLSRRHPDGWRQGAQGRRLDLDRRLHRRSLRRRGANPAQRNPASADLQDAQAAGSRNLPALRAIDDLGRRASQAQSADQRRRAEAGARGDRLRRRRDRPVPHRAHVLRSHRRLPRDDPGRHARRPRKSPGQAVAASAQGF